MLSQPHAVPSSAVVLKGVLCTTQNGGASISQQVQGHTSKDLRRQPVIGHSTTAAAFRCMVLPYDLWKAVAATPMWRRVRTSQQGAVMDIVSALPRQQVAVRKNANKRFGY